MANIKISNLHPTGVELFSDSESYLNDLNDQDIESINGGLSILRTVVKTVQKSSKGCATAVGTGVLWGAGERLVEEYF